ncbi:MAG TPA: hypothetical protein VF519_05675 [Mycobacteriales bacterium]|jgi:hypothetical protein
MPRLVRVSVAAALAAAALAPAAASAAPPSCDVVWHYQKFGTTTATFILTYPTVECV